MKNEGMKDYLRPTAYSPLSHCALTTDEEKTTELSCLSRL